MSTDPKRSDLPVRAATGLVAAAVALACLWFGGTAFWALVALLSAAMIGEWCGLLRVAPWKTGAALALLALLLVLLLAGAQGHPVVLGPRESNYAVAVTPVTFAGPVVAVLGLAVIGGLVTLSAPVGLGLLYVGLPAVSLLFLRSGGGGLFGSVIGFLTTLWVLVVVWSTDIGAYFAGRAIGGPKLAPRLSPKKTWAGLLGGMAAAAIASGLVVLWVVSKHRGEGMGANYVVAAAFGAGAAVLAQAGDLFESWLKRRVGAKDSGRLLPGHGGALDRLDGLVPVSVAMALFLYFGHA